MSTARILSLVNLLHGFVPGAWVVVLSNVLRTHGLGGIVPWSFVVFGLAATLGPLVTGALADRRFAVEKLLRVLWAASAACLLGCGLCLEWKLPPVVFLVFLLLQALSYGPTWSLLAVTSFAHLESPSKDYPKVRVFATLGWILAGWVISWVMPSETSSGVFYLASAGAFVLALVAPVLPHTPPKGSGASRWTDWIGWPAVRLLREREFRNHLVTAFLFTMPLTAYYAYTPIQLARLGCPHVAAAMGLGQAVEVGAMLVLGWLLTRYHPNRMLVVAILFAIARTVLCALGWQWDSWVVTMTGAALHGIVFTFYFTNAQIFIQQSVAGELRAQAQALLVFLTNGLGSLSGYCITGELYRRLTVGGETSWVVFWSVLTGMLCLPLAWSLCGEFGRRAKFCGKK